jgi:hypothetical protein
MDIIHLASAFTHIKHCVHPPNAIPMQKERNVTSSSLICSLEWWNRLALVLVEGVHVYGAVPNINFAGCLLLPRKRVLHPFFIVTVGIIFASVSATRLFAVGGGLSSLRTINC